MKKINIHLVVNEEAYNYCREVNAEICKITHSEITFNDHSPMIPHLSLLRGDVKAKNAIQQVADLTQSVATEFESPQLRVHSPYIASHSGHYILSDISAEEPFQALRKTLFQQLTPQLITPQNSKTETPHLTLGYIQNQEQEVQSYLETVKAEFDFYSPAVEISEEGDRGTCINSLFRFNLQ
jgi:2'-5' RNA ligase